MDAQTPAPTVNDNSALATPDPETAKRIENLGIVGTALAEWSNGTKFDSNIIEAKQALEVFKQGIDKLELTPQSKTGMNNLIKLLGKMLEAKMTDTFQTTQANF